MTKNILFSIFFASIFLIKADDQDAIDDMSKKERRSRYPFSDVDQQKAREKFDRLYNEASNKANFFEKDVKQLMTKEERTAYAVAEVKRLQECGSIAPQLFSLLAINMIVSNVTLSDQEKEHMLKSDFSISLDEGLEAFRTKLLDAVQQAFAEIRAKKCFN